MRIEQKMQISSVGTPLRFKGVEVAISTIEDHDAVEEQLLKNEAAHRLSLSGQVHLPSTGESLAITIHGRDMERFAEELGIEGLSGNRTKKRNDEILGEALQAKFADLNKAIPLLVMRYLKKVRDAGQNVVIQDLQTETLQDGIKKLTEAFELLGIPVGEITPSTGNDGGFRGSINVRLQEGVQVDQGWITNALETIDGFGSRKTPGGRELHYKGYLIGLDLDSFPGNINQCTSPILNRLC